MSESKVERLEEVRRLKTINLYTLFAGITILFSGVYGLFLDDGIYGMVVLFTLPFLAMIPLLNRVGHSLVAVAVLVHICNFSIVVFNLGYGHSTGSQAFIFPIIAGISFLNPLPRHKIEFWVHMILSVFIHAFIFATDRFFGSSAVPSNKYVTLETINYALSLLVTVYILYQHNSKTAVGKEQLASQLRTNEDTLSQLGSVLKDKEVLLAEVHHRVKNNLAIISGMLNLSRNLGKETNVDAVLQECSNRVISMAMVHEKLYKSGDLSRISFHEYVDDLVKDIHRTLVVNKNIQLRTRLDEIFLDIDRAIPVGLIVNEVITNSIKHAFTEGKEGVIEVDVRRSNNSVYLMVRDNGKGMSAEQDQEDNESLGMMLIESLTQQIDGTYEFANNDGVSFVLRFPIE